MVADSSTRIWEGVALVDAYARWVADIVGAGVGRLPRNTDVPRSARVSAGADRPDASRSDGRVFSAGAISFDTACGRPRLRLA